MSETQRTITDLYSKLPDNTARLLSAEDVRDIVETLRSGYGEFSISAEIETVISGIGSYVKVLGTTVLSSSAHHWSMPTSGRLRYDGPADRIVLVIAAFSFVSASNNQEFHFRIAKNDITDPISEQHLFVATVADVETAGLHHIHTVSTDDYFEMWAANATSTGNLTIEHLNLIVVDYANS